MYQARWAREGHSKRDRISFPYELWEQAFIDFTKDLTLKDIGKERATNSAAIDSINEQITDKELRIAKYKELVKDGAFEEMQAHTQALSELSRDLQSLIKNRDGLLAEHNQRNSSDALQAGQSLLHRMILAQGDERIALRLEVRQAIRDLVEHIECRIWRKDN